MVVAKNVGYPAALCCCIRSSRRPDVVLLDARILRRFFDEYPELWRTTGNMAVFDFSRRGLHRTVWGCCTGRCSDGQLHQQAT